MNAQGHPALHRRCTAPPYVGENDSVSYRWAKGADPTARAKGRLGGTQGAADVAEGTGDTVADMANGPREKSLLHPDTVSCSSGRGRSIRTTAGQPRA